jgi:hypothetical protein
MSNERMSHCSRGITAPVVVLGALVMLSFAFPARAQLEDFRTRQLMQDVAELKRVVQRQSQQIEQLQREVEQLSGSKTPGRSTAPEGQKAAEPAASAKWTNLKNWDRIKNGMSEKQVLDILGYPTSSRKEEPSPVKILFYTMPMGNTGFLSGNVELENDRVRNVNRPVLR